VREAAPRLLVVDFDPWCRALAEGALRGQGYRVVSIGDVPTAIRVVQELTPDLALADVALLDDVPMSRRRSSDRARPEPPPAEAGYAILRPLEIEPSSLSRRIVLLKGDADAEEWASAPRLAVLGYVSKPFTPHLLARKIGAHVEQLSLREAAAHPTPTPEPASGEATLEGNVQQFGIPAILEMLHFNQLTGVCTFKSPGGRSGEVKFLGGEVVGARTDEGARDVDAVFRLVGWTEGRFAFHSRNLGAGARLPMCFEEMMLEGMRRLDESRLFPFPMLIATQRVGQA
jgi:CheY-like chemotaxis protein